MFQCQRCDSSLGDARIRAVSPSQHQLLSFQIQNNVYTGLLHRMMTRERSACHWQTPVTGYEQALPCCALYQYLPCCARVSGTSRDYDWWCSTHAHWQGAARPFHPPTLWPKGRSLPFSMLDELRPSFSRVSALIVVFIKTL